MFEFETQLHRFKHEVMTEIVKLARQDKINKEELDKLPYEIIKGEIPKYRCCVYKERAIVRDRSKLASGYLADGSNKFIDIHEDEQIIYVISAACDNCPINRFTVTDSCRSCLAHKCQEACKFKAINYISGRAYINQEACKECGLCKKACPYDAISEVMRPCIKVCPTGALDINSVNRRSIIKKEKCVNCGICMDACPFGAISDSSSIVSVVKALDKKENIYAVVAPSITGQYGNNITFGQIKNAIKHLGFVEMLEAACGADAVVIHEAEEFVERIKNGDKYMTSSCCPGFHSYIEKMFPDQVERISSTVSPMIAAGRLIKKRDPEAKVVFIGPCTAKKSEILKDGLRDAIDYVLTFEELCALFEGYNVNPYECEDEIVEDASIYGRGFGAAGGLTAAIENYIKEKNIDVDFKPVKVSGATEIKRAVTMARIGKLAGNFIEGMLCEGGCINGAAAITPCTKAKTTFVKLNSQGAKKSVLSNINLEEFKDINLEK